MMAKLTALVGINGEGHAAEGDAEGQLEIQVDKNEPMNRQYGNESLESVEDSQQADDRDLGDASLAQSPIEASHRADDIQSPLPLSCFCGVNSDIASWRCKQ